MFAHFVSIFRVACRINIIHFLRIYAIMRSIHSENISEVDLILISQSFIWGEYDAWNPLYSQSLNFCFVSVEIPGVMLIIYFWIFFVSVLQFSHRPSPYPPSTVYPELYRRFEMGQRINYVSSVKSKSEVKKSSVCLSIYLFLWIGARLSAVLGLIAFGTLESRRNFCEVLRRPSINPVPSVLFGWRVMAFRINW